MKKILFHLVVPFLTGFCFGMALCFGLYLMNVGGLRALVSASGGSDLILELIRFASAFGIMSIATHQGLGMVAD